MKAAIVQPSKQATHIKARRTPGGIKHVGVAHKQLPDVDQMTHLVALLHQHLLGVPAVVHGKVSHHPCTSETLKVFEPATKGCMHAMGANMHRAQTIVDVTPLKQSTGYHIATSSVHSDAARGPH